MKFNVDYVSFTKQIALEISSYRTLYLKKKQLFLCTVNLVLVNKRFIFISIEVFGKFVFWFYAN